MRAIASAAAICALGALLGSACARDVPPVSEPTREPVELQLHTRTPLLPTAPPPRSTSIVVSPDHDPRSQTLAGALVTALRDAGVPAVGLPPLTVMELRITPNGPELAAAAGGYAGTVRVEQVDNLTRSSSSRDGPKQVPERPDDYFVRGYGDEWGDSNWAAEIRLPATSPGRFTAHASALVAALREAHMIEPAADGRTAGCFREAAAAPPYAAYRPVFWALRQVERIDMRRPSIPRLVDGAIAAMTAVAGAPTAAGPSPNAASIDGEPSCAALKRLFEAVRAMRSGPTPPSLHTLASVSLESLQQALARPASTTPRPELLPAPSYVDGIAYLPLATLHGATTIEVDELLTDWNMQAAPRAVILDLRQCPGGLLLRAIEIASIFIADGTIATIQSRRGTSEKVADAGRFRRAWGKVPIVVLVSRATEAGGEVLAGALRLSRSARIIGSSTAGSGSVSVLYSDGLPHPLPIDVGRLVLADGWALEGHGLSPDSCLTDAGIVTAPADAEQARELCDDVASAGPELATRIRAALARELE